MTVFSNILCVVDPTQELQPALQRATWLARQSGAKLSLLSCYYNEHLSGGRLFDSRSLKKARSETLEFQESKLSSLAEPLRAEGISVTTKAVWDHPLHEGIVRQSIALKADVVLKDTHHHSALSRALLTNTDWSLIRTCPVPLWLVSPREMTQEVSIIAAIDPFHEHDKPAFLDAQILTIGKAIAEETDANLHVFHSFDPRVAVALATGDAYLPISTPLPEIEKEMQEQHRSKFMEIAKSHGIAKEHTHLLAGFTHQELPKLEAELDANLVIMGAVSRSRIKRLFIGATAERTLGELTCDLLIIKPNPDRRPDRV